MGNARSVETNYILRAERTGCREVHLFLLGTCCGSKITNTRDAQIPKQAYQMSNLVARFWWYWNHVLTTCLATGKKNTVLQLFAKNILSLVALPF